LRRIKHWCELAAHMLIIGSALMRYKAMHAPNRKSSYWAATISAYMISLAAVPLFVRAFAAFDWIKVGGDGGLARTFKIADHVLHRILDAHRHRYTHCWPQSYFGNTAR
jgi:hypothetical protein